MLTCCDYSDPTDSAMRCTRPYTETFNATGEHPNIGSVRAWARTCARHKHVGQALADAKLDRTWGVAHG